MNTRQKGITVGLVILIICIIVFILWYMQIIKLPELSTAPQPIPIQTYPEFTSEIKNVPNNGDDIVIESDEVVIEDFNGFSPVTSPEKYVKLSLNDDMATYASSGLPMPNMSLYNVNTQSYITGLGDPIRGDLEIEPRNNNMYKSQYTHKDARIGALSSIAI